MNAPATSTLFEELAARISIDEALAEMARRHLRDFVPGAWPNMDVSRFISNWHIDAICDHLEAVSLGHIRHLIINAPPRCAKSLLSSVAWPAWVWAQGDDLSEKYPLMGAKVRWIFATYAHNLSVRDAVKTRRLIGSGWYRKHFGLFGLRDDQNEKRKYETTKGGFRFSTSVDGQLTGEGGDVRVVDDPHNVINIDGDTVRKGVLDWWDEAMPTRINDPNTYADVINMQRVHDDDLSGHILKEKNQSGQWVHLCLPMEHEVHRRCHTVVLPGQTKVWTDPRHIEGELLNPQRFGRQAVEDLKGNLGTYGTAGQLQQRPTPRGGAIFKTDAWQKWTQAKYPLFKYVVASLDTAYTEDEENDYSAFTCWGIWQNQERINQAMLIMAWHERLEIHDLVVKAGLTCAKYKVDRVLIEAKASGISVAQEIKRLFAGRGFSVNLRPVKGDKVARAHTVTPLFEDRVIWAPPRAWAQLLIDEAAGFPKGGHDDLVDSMVQALRHFRKTGHLRRTEEELRAILDAQILRPPRKQLYDV